MIRTAAAVALFAAPATAADFTLFIYETPAQIALRANPGPEGQGYWAKWAAFNAALEAESVLRGGTPLAPEASAEAQPDTGLVLGGYFVLETADRSRAEALAAMAPSATNGGIARVVPHLDVVVGMMAE